MRYRNLFFDLDGTITDPQEGIVSAIEYALEKLGYSRRDRRALSGSVGAPLHTVFRELLGEEHGLIEQAVQLFREHYAREGLFLNAPYQGMPPLLEELAAAGARLHIVTSKPQIFAQQILAGLGLSRCFSAIAGPSLEDADIPKAALLSRTMASMGARLAESVMIGDRAFDIEAGRQCDIDGVGVLWGYGSRSELTEAGALTLCETVANLHTHLFD